jgi:hypothetical protein
MITPLEAARQWIRRGRSIVPVPFGSKAPTLKNWTDLRLTEADLAPHFGEPTNIGLLLGEPSGWVVDIDLDTDEAIRATPFFFPPTYTYGRDRRPSSHLLVLCEGAKTLKYSFEGQVFLEVRSSGAQSLVPPSQHPSGDVYRPERGTTPAAELTPAALYSAAARAAAAALFARHWPGGRHHKALALTGALLHAGWPDDDLARFVAAVVSAAQDEEANDRKRACEDTVTRYRKDKNAVTGWPTLVNQFDEPTIKQAWTWLKVPDGPQLNISAAPTEADEAAYKRLAALPLAGYDRCREQEAKDLGIRIGTLDTEVVKRRPVEEAAAGAGKPITFEDPEPWPKPVDGAALLDQLVATFKRYAILPEHAAEVLALWVLQTHCHEAAYECGLVILTSPEMRCGKTRVLKLLNRLCHRPLGTANVSPSVVFRTIDKYTPTFLIDEADTFMKQSDELRGIINSGQSREEGFVIRNVGDLHEPHRFSTFGPKAIALIGTLASTIMDRSFVIKMRRKDKSEKVDRLKAKDRFPELFRHCARWAQDSLEQLKAADSEEPANLNDRAFDNWFLLLAMAEAVVGEWPQRARKATTALSGEGVNEDDSIKVQLLIDIRDILEEWERPHIPSADLVEKLVALEDRPWCEFGCMSKLITPRALANLLRPFGITSGAHRRNDLVFKGYPAAKFEDAFKRYIPAPKEGLNTPSAQDRGILSVTPLQPSVQSHAGETLSVTREPAVTDAKTAKMAPQLRCNAVTDK